MANEAVPAAGGVVAEAGGGEMADRRLGTLPPMRIAGEEAPASGGAFASEAQSAAWAELERSAEEEFAGTPTEDVRRRLEYARLEGRARLMLSAPGRYGDEEFDAVFRELSRRRFIADDRTLAAFDALDGGGRPSGQSRLREFVDFSDRMAKAPDDAARGAVVEDRFMSPEMRAWREAKGRGDVAAAEFARARLKERGRAWGDRVAELRADVPSPNDVMEAYFGGRDGLRVPTLGELWGEAPGANDARMVREYERTLEGEAMRLEAQKLMPHLSEAQRRLVNLAASGADMGEFRGLFLAMRDSDRDLMLSLVQAVRPEWEGNFLAEMGVRAAMGVRGAWRAVRRADVAATDFILNGLAFAATGRLDLWSTPEEREELRRGMLADMQFDEMAGDLRLKDPESFVDKALQGFADSAHLQYSMLGGEVLRRIGAPARNTAPGRAAFVAGLAMEGFATASMIGEEFDNMLLRGVSLDRAAPLAVCGGLVDAWVERWDLRSWLGRDLTPGQMRRVGIRAAVRAAVRMDGREFLRVLKTNARQAVRIAEGELKEEVVQGWNQEGWASVGEGRSAIEAFASSESYRAGMDSLWEALPVCTAFGVFGAANPTGSVSKSAAGAYAERLAEISREEARRRGAETLSRAGMARAARAARNEAARVARATAGMSAKERSAWLSEQEGMSPAMRQFLSEHCEWHEALAAQDGRAFADAVLGGSVDEAVFAKAGVRIGHGADGRIDSVETEDGRSFRVEWRDGAATAADLGEDGVRDLLAEWRRRTGETVDPSDAERVASIIADGVNGFYRDGGIVLFGANADTGTLSHETTHALVDALATSGTEAARRNVAALAEALGGDVGADGRLSVAADESLAEENEVLAREAASKSREAARPDEILWRNAGRNVLTALRRAVRAGGGRAFLPVVRSFDGAEHSPASLVRELVAEGLAAAHAREAAKREMAAEMERIRAEFARPAPNRAEKRRAKIETRRAERERRDEEAMRRGEEERKERKRRAEEEAKARFEEEFRRLEEEEASEEERRAEEGRQAEMDARALENRKRALSRPPRLGWSKNQTGEDAQRARATYLAFWKANAGQAVSQADVDRLEDVYGIPPEAVGLEKTEGGWRLTGRQPLSDEAMYRLQDGLVRLWADLKSVKIIVPDVVVATEEEAAAAVPNEVWDPVSCAFVQGRVVVDPANAKSFREQAGLPEEGASASATPAEVMAELPPERPAASAWTAENPATPDVPGARHYRVALPNSDARLVGRLEVRDAADGVLTSTDAGYHDRANQNRDDASEESRQLVERIGANPDPLQVATVQPMAGNGVVWVLPDGDVIIGNHRVNGVRRGYEKGTADALERFVREDAARRGIPIPRDCRRPLTVFVLERVESPSGRTDVHEVVRLANESQNRGFNVRERAANDAKILLDNNLLAGMAFRPDGRVDERASADAIGPFRRASGAQGLLAEDGSLTEEGQARLQNAALAALLGGAADNALLGKVMSNAGRLDMAPELRGLMRAAPGLLSLAAAKPRYDLRGPLAEALGRFVEWRDRDETARLERGKSRRAWRETRDGRRVRGLSWEEFAAQGDLFSKPSEEAAILGELFAAAESLRSFDREDAESEAGRARVFRLVSGYLADYAANARAVNTETVDMFGSMPATRAEVLSAQREKADAGGHARFSLGGAADARTEYDEVAARYTDRDGTRRAAWMKAPNGRPTKLTERQWVQVRTPSFKRWFGDWEAAAELYAARDFVLDGDPVAEISETEFQKDGRPLVDRVAEFFAGLGGEAVSPELGHVRLDRKGAKSSIAHGIGPKKAAAFAAVKEVLENGVVFDRNTNWKGRRHDTAVVAAPVRIGGEVYVCEVVVVQKPGGSSFYLHEVNKRKMLSDTVKTTTGVVSIGEPARPVRSIIAQRLAEVNPSAVSKVVDENGEPLVVYHGARRAGFSVFDDSEGGKQSDAPEGTAWFSSDPEVARSYSGTYDEVREYGEDALDRGEPANYACFLNIRDPHEADFEGQSWTGDTYGKFALYDTTETDEWEERVWPDDGRSLFDSREEAEAFAEAHGIGRFDVQEDPWLGFSTDSAVQDAMDMGRDGAILKNVDDNGGRSCGATATDYVVFNSNQIKSATDNSGAFDAGNPDIRFSLGGAADARTEYDEVVARYTDRDGTRRAAWMKAPNGRPTKLTERQWVQVRTPSFKRWFGDWEAAALTLPVAARSYSEARTAMNSIVGVEMQSADGLRATISGNSRDKMLSGKAVAKSVSIPAHIAAAANVRTLFERALEWSAEPGKKPNVKSMHRLYAPFAFDGRILTAKISVKEFMDGTDNRLYTIEAIETEDPDGHLASDSPANEKERPHRGRAEAEILPDKDLGKSATGDDRLSKYLSPVNPDSVSKVVDENGEPMVVYHGTNATEEVETWNARTRTYDVEHRKFTVFRRDAAGERNAGHFFSDSSDVAGSMGGEVYPVFLSMRNPLVVDAQGRTWGGVPFDGGFRDANEVAAYAEAHGHDGLILRNVRDGAGFGEMEGTATDYVVFSPSQIKSATDNSGAFDGANPDIRFSVRVNPRLERDLAEAIAGRRKDGSRFARHRRIEFSEMPSLLVRLGLPDVRIESDRARILKIAGKHHLTPAQMADIPNRCGSPAAVFRDGADAYDVLTDMTAMTDGGAEKPVMVRLTRKTAKTGETVFIASAYAREADKESEYVRLARTNGAFLYVDAKKVASLGLEEGTTSTLCTSATRDGVKTAEERSAWASTPQSIPQSGAERGTRFSISHLYTGSAADYANRSRRGGEDDGPSLHKVGTGSRMAVYGWGLYASDSRKVAEEYAKGAGATRKAGSSHVYEQTFFTDRAPGDESRIIKWEEPVSGEQRELVREGLKGLGGEARKAAVDFVNRERRKDLDRDGLEWRDVEGEDAAPEWYPDDVLFDYLDRYIDLGAKGCDVYGQLAEALGSPKAASEFLAQAGIDGVKHSREYIVGEGAGWNYVSFRDDNIRVDHKWTDGEIRFSVRVNPRLREDVEAALNTDRARGEVLKGGRRIVLCDAPRIFSEIGMPDGAVYTKAYTLRKIAKEHSLTAAQIASVPELLERPAVVFSDNGEGFVFLTDATAPDRNGKTAPVMVYVRPDGSGNYIASAYSRTEAAESKYVSLANARKVLYIDKRKVAHLPLRGEALSSLITFSVGDGVKTAEERSAWASTPQSIPQSGAEREAAAQETRFSVVTDRKTLDWFDGAEKIHTYRTFVRIGGRLYSPVRTRVDGRLTEPVELGTLYVADERPETAHMGKRHAPKPKDGRARESDGKWYVDLDKGRDGKLYDIAYNPYWHSSNLALNDQFTSAWRRDLVTVRCEIAREDVESGYHAERAHNAVGRLNWHKGTVAGQLDADNDRHVYLSRYLRPVEVLSDDETAALYVEAFKGRTDFRVDGRVVTPGLARALRERGVAVSPSPAERTAAARETRLSLSPPSGLVGAMDRRAARAVRPRQPRGPSPYFEEADGAMDFPLAALRAYRDEPEASVRAAARRMDETASGLRAKLPPLTLADRGDGTFAVVDGAATARAAALRGMPAVRAVVAGRDMGTRLANSAYLVRNENADAPLRSEGASTLDAALANAAENADALEAVVRAAAAKTGGEAVMRPADAETGKPTKGRASAGRKLRDECGGDVSRLLDLVGGTVVLDDGADLSDALMAIRAALPDGASVARVKKLNFGEGRRGYRDVKVSVRFANGGIGEVILVERFMNDAKFNRGGHAVYEIARILQKYEGRSPEVDAARSDLKKLSEAIYGRGADAVTPAHFARMKARASSSMAGLNLPDNATANSSSDMAVLKKLSSGLNLAMISQSSNATPASSLMKNIDYSFADYGGNVADSGADVNPADEAVDAARRLGRPRAAEDADPERPSRLFSIGDRSPMGIAKHVLGRETIEYGRPPSADRVKAVARAFGYVGDMGALAAAAEREAERQRTLLRVIATDPKIERTLAAAGLSVRNDRRIARARSAAVQYSREVSEASERSRRAAERAARMMRGEDYEQMVAREGLDMEAILLAIRPEERRATGTGDGGEAGETPPGPPKPLSEDERRALAEAVGKAVANGAALVAQAKADMAAKKAREAARAAADAEARDGGPDDAQGGGGDGGGDGGDDGGADAAGGGQVAEAFRRAIRGAGLTLDSPEAMVQLVKAVTEKYARDFPKEFPDADPADPWSSPLVQARFASNLAEFARAVAAAYAPSYARIRIARRSQMLDDRSLRTVRQVEEAGEALFRDLHGDVLRQTRSEIVGEIKKILRPHAKNWRPNVERQERRGVESALGRWCRFAYRAIEMSAAAVEERSRQLEDELRSWAGTAEGEAERYREFADRKTELEALDMFGHLRGRMPAELADLRDHVRQVVDESRFEEMQFGEKWERSRAAAAEAVAEAIVGDPKMNGVTPGDDAAGGLYSLVGMLETKATQLTRWCRDAAARARSLRAFAMVEEMVQSAEDRKFNYLQEEKAKLKEAVERVYGSAREGFRALSAEVDPSLWPSLDRGGQKTAWTAGNVVQMYASCVQSDYADNCAKWQRDGGYVRTLEDVMDSMDPRHVDFLRELRRLYLEQGDALGETLERTTGTRLLTPNRLYMPVRMRREANVAAKGRARAYSPFAPSLTPRVRNGLDFDQSADVLDIFMERAEDAAHTIGWADVGSMVQGVFLSDRVMNAIRSAHGARAMRQWNSYVLDVLAGPEGGGVDAGNWGVAGMRLCARLASRTYLGLNVASWAKQLAAVPCFALSSEGSLRDAAKSVAFCALHPLRAFRVMRDLSETAAFRARYGTAISQELRHATSDAGVFRGWLDRAFDAAMSGVMLFDKFGVYALAGVYHHRRCELETQGKSPAEASELASSWLMHIVDKTAQTSRTVNSTELQRAGGAWGILLQFKSAPAQQTQFELAAVQDALAAPGDAKRWKRAAAVVLINHVIVPTFNTAIESLLLCLTSWGVPDEEKRLRLVEMWIANCVSGSLGSILFLGAVLEGAGDLLGKLATGQRVNARDLGDSLARQMPAADMLKLWATRGGKAVEAFAELTDGDVQDGAYDLAKHLSALVPGLSWPARKGFQAYESATDR